MSIGWIFIIAIILIIIGCMVCKKNIVVRGGPHLDQVPIYDDIRWNSNDGYTHIIVNGRDCDPFLLLITSKMSLDIQKLFYNDFLNENHLNLCWQNKPPDDCNDTIKNKIYNTNKVRNDHGYPIDGFVDSTFIISSMQQKLMSKDEDCREYQRLVETSNINIICSNMVKYETCCRDNNSTGLEPTNLYKTKISFIFSYHILVITAYFKDLITTWDVFDRSTHKLKKHFEFGPLASGNIQKYNSTPPYGKFNSLSFALSNASKDLYIVLMAFSLAAHYRLYNAARQVAILTGDKCMQIVALTLGLLIIPRKHFLYYPKNKKLLERNPYEDIRKRSRKD